MLSTEDTIFKMLARVPAFDFWLCQTTILNVLLEISHGLDLTAVALCFLNSLRAALLSMRSEPPGFVYSEILFSFLTDQLNPYAHLRTCHH